MARYFGWTFRARFAQIMEGDKKFSSLGGPFGRGGGGRGSVCSPQLAIRICATLKGMVFGPNMV